MKTLVVWTTLFCLISFMSCSNDINEVDKEQEDIPSVAEGVSLTDGYLTFASEFDLENYLLDKNPEEQITTRSMSNDIPGFKSLSTLKKEQVSKLRTTANVDDEEEMTEDEYNIARAEDLLLDPVLTEVMDTTLRIGVGERVYKITQHGTFSTLKGNQHKLESAINNFDTTLVHTVESGAYYALSNDITFTNSFGRGSVESSSEGLVEEVESAPQLRMSNFNNDLHNGYNVNTYKWQNNSVWQNFWDKIRGKDVFKENYFNSKRRVQVNVYNVNYAFYASSGVKVKMQKRKKIWFVKYWVSTDADKMAIGFNKVWGEMKYTNPQSFSKITPTASTQWSHFTGTLNGLTSNFIAGQYKKFDLVKDWVDDLYIFLPEVKLMGTTYPNRDHMNMLYNAPAEQVYSFLKSQTNKYIFAPTQKKIQPKDPRLSFYVWGNSTSTYDKDRSYFMGVKEYGRRSSKSVRFDQSFGFQVNNGSVGGFVPTEFKIKEIDTFGAAYYDGQWKGVRLYK